MVSDLPPPIAYLPAPMDALYHRIIIALILLLIGLILTRLASRVFFLLLSESGIGDVLRRWFRNRLNWERHLTSFAAFCGYCWSIAVMLRYLGLLYATLLILGISAATSLIILSLLKLLSVVPNYLAGRYLLRSRMLLLGKQLALPGISGKIIRFTFSEIQLKTKRGDILHIPHRYVRKLLH